MKNEIRFFNENEPYTIRGKGMLRKWIQAAIEKEGKVTGSLNFILCDDDYLSEMNINYLNHRSLTDILTFPFNETGDRISGDIYISFPRIKENAAKFKQSVEDELHRVMIHGVLHLIGYGDSTKDQKREMTGKENYHLGLLKG